MLGKSSIQLSVDEWGSVPCLLFTWDQTMVEVVKIMATSFKKSHAGTAALSAPDAAAGQRQPTPLPETPGHSQASLVGSLLLSPGSWCTQGSICALQEYILTSIYVYNLDKDHVHYFQNVPMCSFAINGHSLHPMPQITNISCH